MKNRLFQHTGQLVLFLLKRDRFVIPIWIMGILFFTYSVAAVFPDLYQTAEERQSIAATMNNPAIIAMVGPGYGLDDYTPGAMMAHQMLLFTSIAAAIMSILLVTRHLRADEEEGRLELIRSFQVGRLANSSASFIVLLLVNIVLALIIGFGLAVMKIESMDLEGSVLYGTAIGAGGFMFAMLTAIFNQLTQNARSALGLSFSALGIFYLIRAIGDIDLSVLSWFSPFGYVTGTKVFVENDWLPLCAAAGIGLILGAAAFYLQFIRDLGTGFLPAKKGREKANKLLLSSLGLTFRLQRTGFICWIGGMFILGISYGAVLGDLESFFQDVDLMKNMLVPIEGYTLTEQFLPMLLSVMAMIGTIPVLMSILKLAGEEKSGRAESIYSLSISRNRYLWSYIILALISAFFMLSAMAIGLWSAAAAVMVEPFQLSQVLKGAFAFLPALFVMTSISILLVGISSKYGALIWIYLLYSFVVVYLGNLLQFPDWMSKLSPYGYIPKIPVENINYSAATMMTIIAALIMIAGSFLYSRRDISG
ncbi:ABC transporter permease [Cytobacillus gottheilii]|uniref:ABC transporter permease n=1 Tax=Cytobacillus gottheilii TaxID=859144 RepID=UPI00111A97BA|nr:ABC transporter permease [Cytobacillus gottheilii]